MGLLSPQPLLVPSAQPAFPLVWACRAPVPPCWVEEVGPGPQSTPEDPLPLILSPESGRCRALLAFLGSSPLVESPRRGYLPPQTSRTPTPGPGSSFLLMEAPSPGVWEPSPPLALFPLPPFLCLPLPSPKGLLKAMPCLGLPGSLLPCVSADAHPQPRGPSG